MNAAQARVLDSFVRVRTFIAGFVATGPVDHSRAFAALDEALEGVLAAASAQEAAPAMRRGEGVRQAEMLQRLKNDFMRPIVTIVRAQTAPGTDPALQTIFRLPAAKLGVSSMLIACDAMIAHASDHADLFIAEGMPPDFLEQFRRARDEVHRLRQVRTALRGEALTAGLDLRQQLRKGRLAVNRLDAIVRSTYDRDDAVLTAWRVAKRVHRRGGGRSAPAPVSGDAGDAPAATTEPRAAA